MPLSLLPFVGLKIPYNVVFPSQFAHLVIQYQQHPEAKSLAPDGTPCTADTQGLLQRAHVIAGDIYRHDLVLKKRGIA